MRLYAFHWHAPSMWSEGDEEDLKKRSKEKTIKGESLLVSLLESKGPQQVRRNH